MESLGFGLETQSLGLGLDKKVLFTSLQEAQLSLMLTTGATRLVVSRGQHSTIPYIRYSYLLCNNFVFQTRHFYDIRL